MFLGPDNYYEDIHIYYNGMMVSYSYMIDNDTIIFIYNRIIIV